MHFLWMLFMVSAFDSFSFGKFYNALPFRGAHHACNAFLFSHNSVLLFFSKTSTEFYKTLDALCNSVILLPNSVMLLQKVIIRVTKCDDDYIMESGDQFTELHNTIEFFSRTQWKFCQKLPELCKMPAKASWKGIVEAAFYVLECRMPSLWDRSDRCQGC